MHEAAGTLLATANESPTTTLRLASAIVADPGMRNEAPAGTASDRSSWHGDPRRPEPDVDQLHASDRRPGEILAVPLPAFRFGPQEAAIALAARQSVTVTAWPA